MRQEISPQRSNEEPCQTPVMGVFTSTEKQNFRGGAPGDDSAPGNVGCETARSSNGIGAFTEKSAANRKCQSRMPFTVMVVFLIKIYQWTVAPLLPRCCRFEPSCSHYAIEAFQRHGLFKGGVLTIWRLLRCQPWGKSGYDPVPPRGCWRN